MHPMQVREQMYRQTKALEASAKAAERQASLIVDAQAAAFWGAAICIWAYLSYGLAILIGWLIWKLTGKMMPDWLVIILAVFCAPLVVWLGYEMIVGLWALWHCVGNFPASSCPLN